MTTKLKKRLSLAAAGLAIIGVTVIPGSPAQASINTCGGWWESASSWSGYCDGSGPSTFRSWLKCYPWSGGAPVNRSGPWRIAGAGVRSVAVCSSGYDAAGPWVETHL